jgi:hypothetical protein
MLSSLGFAKVEYDADGRRRHIRRDILQDRLSRGRNRQGGVLAQILNA